MSVMLSSVLYARDLSPSASSVSKQPSDSLTVTTIASPVASKVHSVVEVESLLTGLSRGKEARATTSERGKRSDSLPVSATASPIASKPPWLVAVAEEELAPKGLPKKEDIKTSVSSKPRVPNAPKSSIGEIFSQDSPDNGPMKNCGSRPRVVRDTPTRPRDTHTRLFGQVANAPVVPMVTDTIRSHIQFGEAHTNGVSPAQSPSKSLPNGSASSTPGRGEMDLAEYSSQPKRNPVTGDGVTVPPPPRRHPMAAMRGAAPTDYRPHSTELEPQPTHRYFTRDWPPRPADYYVPSTVKPRLDIRQTPYSLLGLKTDDPEKEHPIIDPDSLSPQPVLDRHWPPFPAQHYLEPAERKIAYHPLPPYAFVSLTSALGDRPKPDFKYDPVPSLDGPIDPYLMANTDPPPSLFKYERDGPIPDVSLFPTPVARGPHTLTGFPPIFPRHVPGYLFNINRPAEDFQPKTYFVDYVRQRAMEGNPITGEGYKSMNGQINTVTSLSSHTSTYSNHNRVPPGGYSSRLW